VDKKSFNSAISKGMQKSLAENIEFLKQIPFFQGWTKNSLTKFLLHSVEIHKVQRNQLIYKEGDASTQQYVYFIKSGEFKVVKKFKKEKKMEDNVGDLIYKHKDLTKKIVDPFKISNFTNAKQLQNQMQYNQ
jgi:hypothetical protein